jgi:3-phenylpropionate/cinnamic acid dioxygenase small subunit
MREDFDVRAAEALLIREARLLDDRQLDDWLAMFADDALYWVPIEDTSFDQAGRSTSLILDGDVRREERVYRLLHTPLPSQSPPSRTLHSVTNVELVEPTESLKSDVAIRSIQTIHEVRTGNHAQRGLGEPRVFAGHAIHELVFDGDEPKIKAKKLVLLNRDQSIPNLTFML